MAQRANLEAEPLFTLLTDALRAGPGSPQWREAVAQLRTDDSQADEVLLLRRARENLESGKDYKTVHAGPTFTRKVLEQIDDPAGARRSMPMATVIGVICAVLIVAALAIVGFQLSRSGKGDAGVLPDLAGAYFSNEVRSASFQKGAPEQYKTFGKLPLEFSSGVRAGKGLSPKAAVADGGLFMTDPLPSDEPFTLEVNLNAFKAPAPGIFQIFVANSSDPSSGKFDRELLWLAQDSHQRVMVAGQSEVTADVAATPETTVRIVLDRHSALIELKSPGESKKIYSGPHKLSGQEPRYVGVRFIALQGNVPDVVVKSIKVYTRSTGIK